MSICISVSSIGPSVCSLSRVTMIKISDSLRSLINNNSFLQFGLNARLFNLAQLAKFLTPLVKARTKKEVSNSALVMALSRLQSSVGSPQRAGPKFKVESLTIQSGLVILTLDKTTTAHKAVSNMFLKIQKNTGYCTITEARSEITVILEAQNLNLAKDVLELKPTHRANKVASISAKFPKTYLAQPGFLFAILQSLTIQNINLIEVASSATEFIIYIDENDLRLAFDTLYHCFSTHN